MGNAASDIKALVEALRPCEGGNQAIHGLHAADNMDKHRVFLFLAQVAGSPFPIATSESGTVTLTFMPQERLELLAPGEAFRIKRMLALSDGQEFSPSFDVAFGEPAPFLGEPVLPLLGQLAHYVKSLIEAFAAYCLRGKQFGAPEFIMNRTRAAKLLRIS